MFGILDAIKMGASALIAGLVAFYLGHAIGKSTGRALERGDALARSIELIKERSKTNEDVGRMDDAALCRDLGGVWVQDDNVCQ